MEELDLFNQPAPETSEQPEPQNSPEHNLVSLADGREFVMRGRETGVTCPCCGQLAKVYNRQIHSTIAKMLIRIYLLWKNSISPDQYHHLSAIIDGISATGINDFSKLVYWGLIEEQPRDPENTKNRTSGYWKITQKGINFVTNKLSLPKYALIYDNQVLDFRGEFVNIIQCLGKKFNYEELMNTEAK